MTTLGTGQGGSPTPEGTDPARAAQHRFVQQSLPRAKPFGFPGPAEEGVGVADDRRAIPQQMGRGEAVSDPLVGQQPSIPAQVVFMGLGIAVDRTVVLVQSAGADDPQVGAGRKRPVASRTSCCGSTGIPAARCSVRMIDSQADSLRGSRRGMTRRRSGAPRRRRAAATFSSPIVTSPARSAQSPIKTRSSTPRSRAAANRVSAAVVTRRPSTRFIATGSGCRHTSRPGRRGRGSTRRIAANTGTRGAAGSHHPRSCAAVR